MGESRPETFTKDETAAVYVAEDSNTNVNRTYKASLFEEVFREKKEALALYNAMNGTSYSDENALTIMTISGALYMDYKNDVSFLIDDTLNLYEHQSTWNPNMPLRGLGYFARMYEDYVRINELDMYSEIRLKLPKAQYYVFYNGTTDEPDRQILRLSDSFPDDGIEPHLEVLAVVLNINYGHNRELMKKCQTLHDYALFIDKIRMNLKKGYTKSRAIDLAIDECIANDILRNFLVQNRTGVKRMLFGKEDWERIQKLRIQKAVSEAVEQEIKASEKKLTDARKSVIDAEQKAAHAEQKAAHAEQKAVNAEEQRVQTQQKCIIEVLEQYGMVSDEVRQRIQNETDVNVLQQWFTLTLHVGSAEVFMQKIESTKSFE